MGFYYCEVKSDTPVKLLKVTSDAVRSKQGGYAVVYSLFVVAPIVCEGFVLCPCFALQYFVSFLVLQSYAGEERAVCLTFVVF